MLNGIDVSFWQGQIDWPSVRQAGIAFSFAKATQGATYADPNLTANVTGAQKVGILAGAYHFFQFAASPQDQAKFFLSKISALSLDLPPVLDYEDATTINKVAAASAIKTWLDIVEAGTGHKPIIYTNANFWDTYIGSPAWATAYPLWIANWTAGAEPFKPKSWSSWLFWQFTNQGKIAGIQGNVDLDRCALTQEDLLKLMGKQPAAASLEDRVAVLEDTLKTIKAALQAKSIV
jgi:lysozyme